MISFLLFFNKIIVFLGLTKETPKCINLLGSNDINKEVSLVLWIYIFVKFSFYFNNQRVYNV